MALKKRRPTPRSSSGFRIGTVSQLTGIDPHTIRAWERRYGALEPSRSEGGARLYTDENVARLQLIKAAVDAGDAISIVAPLSDDELRARLADVSGLARRDAAADLRDLDLEQRPLRLCALGANLSERLRANTAGLAELDVVVSETTYADCLGALRSQPADVLVIALDTLGEVAADRFRELREASGARLGIVLYDFARRTHLAQLSEAGAKLLRGPLSVPDLRRAIFDLLVIRETHRQSTDLGVPIEIPIDEAPPPQRIYTDRQIARLSEISSSIECECPNHLSTLISNLVQFERYSEGCKSQSPQDAALHARLALGTGRARALIEQLLTEVCHRHRIRI